MRNIDPNEFGDADGMQAGTPGELPVTPVPTPTPAEIPHRRKKIALLWGAIVVVAIIIVLASM